MTENVIATPVRTTIPVVGGGSFPVRRVYCIGRNYAAHTIEMGYDPDREDPFFFQKNPENLDTSGQFPYPPKSENVHHEIELIIALKSGGRDIATADALSHVYGYGIGLDMTRRDLQGQMKKAGRPWEIGKAFERSAPIGPLYAASDVGHIETGRISLQLNGEIQQDGDLNQMIWKVPEMINYLSQYYDIAAGDVIMSGTPSGVGPVVRGDIMVGTIDGLGELKVEVV